VNMVGGKMHVVFLSRLKSSRRMYTMLPR
jgi:hypothetical protein